MEETRVCQSCKNSFKIDASDFNFYEKMQVPAPTWCPECRLIRRFAFMNIRTLYKRTCDLCGVSIISMYYPMKKLKVYCNPCWWADTWDGTEYAMEYDPSRPFFEQLIELKNKTPFMALECTYTSNINTPYTNYTAWQKNSYLTYFGDYVENSLYSMMLAKIRDCMDCYHIDESELCYGSIDGHKLYNCHFTIGCGDCHDVHFSRNCYVCSNCLGCVNLRKKSYCIWNVQYTKEEYKKKMEEIQMASWKTVESTWKQLKEFSLKFPRRYYMGDSRNKNVSGEYVYESKNAHDVYVGVALEDSRYTQFITLPKTKDAYDYTGWGNNSEKIYECEVVGEGASNCRFSAECFSNALNLEYCLYAINSSKDCFGCVNIKKKQYCILNKQYSKEEYVKLRGKIMVDMSENPYVDEQGRVYRYGEFLPTAMSPFAYNETIAQDFFPLTEKGALEKGFSWFENVKPVYIITKKATDLPDSIENISDEILNDVIECALCKRGFKIVSNELSLLKKFNLPIPHYCPECRHKSRFIEVQKPKLYYHECMKCDNPIKTSYARERPEIVYCEKCYQQEVY